MMTEQEELEKEKYQYNVLSSFKGIGLGQIIIAFLEILLGILTICAMNLIWRGPGLYSRIGDGIWCNIFGLIAGILCCTTACHLNLSMVFWTSILSVIALLFTIVFIVIEICGFFEDLSMEAYGVVAIHAFQLVFGSAQLTMCIYNTIVFSRIFFNNLQRNKCEFETFFPCCVCCTYQHPSTFAYVVYAQINPKKHDA